MASGALSIPEERATVSRGDSLETYDLIVTDGMLRMIIRCESEDKFMALATALESVDITFEVIY